MLIVDDWRSTDPAALGPLYARERRRWLDALRWDSSDTWTAVEAARVGWGLPGLIAVDGKAARGFTFYVREGRRMDVGGFSADAADVTQALVDGLIHHAVATDVATISFFVYDDASALLPELTRRGFSVQPFEYLVRATGTTGAAPGEPTLPPGWQVTGWRPESIPSVARLMRSAYTAEAGRFFAPNGTLAEWRRYTTNLVEQTACGCLVPDATRLVCRGDEVGAILLVTTIAPGVAHLAQMAVHPELRQHGVARGLLVDGLHRCSQLGLTLMTLLVSANNRPASALYSSEGFRRRAAFVAASGQPRRLTRVALASGGAITRL